MLYNLNMFKEMKSFIKSILNSGEMVFYCVMSSIASRPCAVNQSCSNCGLQTCASPQAISCSATLYSAAFSFVISWGFLQDLDAFQASWEVTNQGETKRGGTKGKRWNATCRERERESTHKLVLIHVIWEDFWSATTDTLWSTLWSTAVRHIFESSIWKNI